MSHSLPVNIAIVLSFVIFSLYILGIHNIVTSYQKNDCEMTFMFQYPQFVEISLPPEVRKVFPKYALYGYGEGGITEQLRKMNFKGIPVLFIPGSSGSYKQGRSLASVSLRKSLNSRTPFHFNYFMIDFIEEQSALFGGVLRDQTKFVLLCIKKILALYENNDKYKPDSVILIGHSMGGLLAKGVFMDPEFDPKLVRLVISLATPHKYPLYQPDYYITSYYKELHDFWKRTPVNHTVLISIGGGPKDILVHSDVTLDSSSDINVLTTAVPGVWLTNDHLSIMWCKQLILTIIRSIFDSVDLSTRQLTTDKEYMKQIFQYHFLKRNAGKKFSGSFMSRFSSFERSLNWYENLQRQFTVTEPKGLKTSHYIMIRLFSEPKNEACFIEAYNVNIKDWIFVCSADVVYNSIRMCDTGENISNMTEIAPVDTGSNLKRKTVHLNLHELKSKSFTHVIVKLPPSDSYMSVNVDVHQLSDRNISRNVPKYYSVFPQKLIEETQESSLYYLIELVGFEYIWQSFVFKLTVLSCKTEKNLAVVSFVTPWSNEDQHFIFHGKNTLSLPLNLVTPKPRNLSGRSHPFVKLQLDPTCRYEATIQSSVVGMFSQGARYYSFMLPGFIACVALLTLRRELRFLDVEGKCVLLQSALTSAVRPYYIVLQASVFGSKLLGLGFFLSVLPVPDLLILQELNLGSFFLVVLLYAVAVVITYSLGTAIYVLVILSGQAAKKMALRFVAKAISGVFNWSDWVVATLHQVPFLVAAILISLSLSTTGALSLWLGTFFYYLKLCKMYEEHLDEWFNHSLKMVALKVKDFIVNRRRTTTERKAIGEDAKTGTEGSGVAGEETTGTTESQAASGTTEAATNEPEADLLAAIHFHVSVMIVWFLTSLLYVPSLLMWVKGYYYSTHLEGDPALLPSIIVNACGAVLWQQDVPLPCKKLTRITSTGLFLLALTSIIYASLSVYRLGYIFSAGLSIVALDQILAKYIQ